MKTACALAKYRAIYRHRKSLEDEAGPRVKNRRVAPPMGRGSAAFAVDLRPNQGVNSLVLVRGSVLAPVASWYIPFWVFLSVFSSDVRNSLGSTYLLDNPLLGLQVMRI